MNKQIAGWIIISMCILWGVLRTIDLVEPNFVLSFFAEQERLDNLLLPNQFFVI